MTAPAFHDYANDELVRVEAHWLRVAGSRHDDPDMLSAVRDEMLRRFRASTQRCASIGCTAPAHTMVTHTYPAPPMPLCITHARTFYQPVPSPMAAW